MSYYEGSMTSTAKSEVIFNVKQSRSLLFILFWNYIFFITLLYGKLVDDE